MHLSWEVSDGANLGPRIHKGGVTHRSDIGFAAKATRLLRISQMMQWAITGLMHRSK